jgi:hypothetical protein
MTMPSEETETATAPTPTEEKTPNQRLFGDGAHILVTLKHPVFVMLQRGLFAANVLDCDMADARSDYTRVKTHRLCASPNGKGTEWISIRLDLGIRTDNIACIAPMPEKK